MSASSWILPWILATLFIATGLTETFKQRAQNTIKLVEDKLHIEECIKNASQKAKSVFREPGNRQFAGLWISMYSRVCLINEDLLTQDKSMQEFPFRLNKELRCLRNTKRDSTLRDIFVKVRNIIDESLDVFGMHTYQTVYRGTTAWNYEGQSHFVEEGYFSTSTDATPAMRFAMGKIFLIVEDMKGLYIGNFVQYKFRYQNEVLGKSGKVFEIKRKVTDKNEINKTVSKLDVHWDKLPGIGYPETIIYIGEVSGTYKQTVLDQQWPSMESYCSVDDHTSAGSEIHGKTLIIEITVIYLLYIYI